MIDVHGREHRINVVGDLMRDAQGTVIGTHGFYIDVTPAENSFEDRISERVAEVSDRRAFIEQAKGMLAVVYGLETDAAFEILKWISQRSNRKLRDVAERLVEKFRALSAPILPERHVYDDALMDLLRGTDAAPTHLAGALALATASARRGRPIPASPECARVVR